jgi:hypothetical protein
VDEGDGGDLQVVRADADAELTEPLEFDGGQIIEFQDHQSPVVVQVSFQSSVGLDLLNQGPRPRLVGQPAPRLLFEVDDSRRDLFRDDGLQTHL